MAGKSELLKREIGQSKSIRTHGNDRACQELLDTEKMKIPSDVSPIQSFPDFAFNQFSRDADVHFYTGFSSVEVLECLFDFLRPVASSLTYWDTNEADKYPNASNKLTIEQEFLLTLMRLKFGLHEDNLASQFCVSKNCVNIIFFTWLRFISLHLKFLIRWPEAKLVKQHLPECFKRYYPKCRLIIDFPEIAAEAPERCRLLCDLSEKHDHNIKLLIAITPIGAITFISECYLGFTSDAEILKDCGILDMLSPGDQILGARKFEIEDVLAKHDCTFTVPQKLTGKAAYLSNADVGNPSSFVNVGVFLEQATSRINDYLILRNELPSVLIPWVDDIVSACAIFSNLKQGFELKDEQDTARKFES